jgi:hypothetical protein
MKLRSLMYTPASCLRTEAETDGGFCHEWASTLKGASAG